MFGWLRFNPVLGLAVTLVEFALRLGVSIRRLEAHGNRLAPLCLSVFGPLFILFASVYWVLRALFQHGVFIWRLFRQDAAGARAPEG